MSRTHIYNVGVSRNFYLCKEENKRLVNDFIIYISALDRNKSTIDSYKNKLELFFSWNYTYNEDRFFIDLKNRDFIMFINYLKLELNSSINRICSIKSALSSFSSCIELLYDEEYPTFKNRIKNINIGCAQSYLPKTTINNNQLQLILDKLVKEKKYQLACWLSLLASSGCRRSEALQMKVTYFNEEHEVFNGTMYKSDIIRTKGRGCNGKRISKYIIKNSFQPYLDLWLKERRRLKIKNEYLFISHYRGTYYRGDIGLANSFSNSINRLFDIDYYNHCMRHYFCTKLIEEGIPEDIIIKLFKWSSKDMIKVYSDLNDEVVLDNYFSNSPLMLN